MTNSFAKMIGAACAIATLFILSAGVSAAPLSLAPSAQAAPKAKAAPIASKAQHFRKAAKRSRGVNPAASGHADLAFLSAGQYLDLSAADETIPVVAETEFSPLDFVAGNVRLVDSDELTEIDLANDPEVLLAQHSAQPQEQPVQQASAATPATDSSDDDDSILNRILMTFAGALAMASAMRMIIA